MKELALEKKLTDESYFLKNVNWVKGNITDKKIEEIRKKQDEAYKKSEFLKKYRKAKEKLK